MLLTEFGTLFFFSDLSVMEIILGSKSMGAIFQEKDKEMLKKGKTFENLGKHVHNLKIFLKRADDCMQ